MKTLVDFHHADLFHSLQLLLEDRLGIEVYRPVGIEWSDRGYWAFGASTYGDDRLAQQFLVAPTVGHVSRSSDGYVFDPAHPERPIRTVTLDEFRDMDDWAYIVASVPDNEPGFSRLAREVGAQYVLQVGNTGQSVNWGLDPLALVSSSEVRIHGRGVRYHQEFESGAGQDFGFAAPGRRDVISSFVNLMPRMECGPLMARYQAALSDLDWWVFGIDCPHGIVKPLDVLAKDMAYSAFGWHDKVTGDGFGHVIHQWAAIGRPLIGHASHYRGQMAEPFWQDGVTCVDLDLRSFDENVQLIRDISADPQRHAEMCRAIRATFDSLVDYEAEAAAIAELLGLKVAVAA